MKGIILAGDTSKRLYPLTTVVPKQLLPVYDRPMIYYPIETLVNAGIKDILIITTLQHQGLFMEQLGDGSSFNVNLSYLCQREPKGIAEAFKIAHSFIDKTGVCLITGDTILTGSNLSFYIDQAKKAIKISGSATIFVCPDYDEEQYGKVIIGKGGGEKQIVGKNNNFHNSMVGLYVFPEDVKKTVESVTPSERGLLEMTSLCEIYLRSNRLQILNLNKNCTWLDTNTFDSILMTSSIIKTIKTTNISI